MQYTTVRLEVGSGGSEKRYSDLCFETTQGFWGFQNAPLPLILPALKVLKTCFFHLSKSSFAVFLGGPRVGMASSRSGAIIARLLVTSDPRVVMKSFAFLRARVVEIEK